MVGTTARKAGLSRRIATTTTSTATTSGDLAVSLLGEHPGVNFGSNQGLHTHRRLTSWGVVALAMQGTVQLF